MEAQNAVLLGAVATGLTSALLHWTARDEDEGSPENTPAIQTPNPGAPAQDNKIKAPAKDKLPTVVSQPTAVAQPTDVAAASEPAAGPAQIDVPTQKTQKEEVIFPSSTPVA